MPTKDQILSQYARMWPREVFYRLAPTETTNKTKGATKAKKGKKTPRLLFRHIELLAKPGVYVLYRDGVPYYVGQAKKLRSRLWQHACAPDTRYYNFWNFFSAFVVENEGDRNDIESILIAAMPTANSAKPKIKRESLPVGVRRMVREIGWNRANPPDISSS